MIKNESKTAAIAIIGNEILSGRTNDSNLKFLATQLNLSGIQVIEARVISDNELNIVETVNYFRSRVDYVFTTGGIGPTHDDITSLSISKAFGVEHVRHPEAESILRDYYKNTDLTTARLKMAEMPVGAELLLNPVSMAPGFKIENVYVLPGVPRILRAMFNLFSSTLVGGIPLLSRSGITYLGEGRIGDKLGEVQKRFPDVQIGSYPFYKDGESGTCILARHNQEEKLDTVFRDIRTMISDLGGELKD